MCRQYAPSGGGTGVLSGGLWSPRYEDASAFATLWLLRCILDPIPRTSVVNLDSVESVAVATLVERLGRLSDDRLRQICRALEIGVACEA